MGFRGLAVNLGDDLSDLKCAESAFDAGAVAIRQPVPAGFVGVCGHRNTLLLDSRPSRPKELPLQIIVRDNNIDQALKALKKKMQREGIFREMKLRGHYEKPSEKRARERAEAIRRYRKLQRKRMQREGLLPK
jgi:small subunit ribosomal protein S21